MALFATAAARQQLRYLLVALSLGNLVFIRRWYDLENLRSQALDYYRGVAPPENHVLLNATLLASLAVALLFRLAWVAVEKWPALREPGECMFLITLAYPLESIRQYWNAQSRQIDMGANVALIALELLLMTGVAFRLMGSLRIVHSARTATLTLTLLIPAVILDFGTAQMGEEAKRFADRNPLPKIAPSVPAKRRFLWILFDELDQRLAFDERPAGVELPNLDRLRAESASANHILQTGTDTILAIPSLFTGQLLARVQVVDASTLLVTPESTPEAHTWHDQPSVFRRARALGVNAALVGWYHPYCRVLGDQVVSCEALSAAATPSLQLEAFTEGRGFWRSVVFLLRMQRESIVNVFQGNVHAGWLDAQDRIVQREQQQQYFKIRDRAYQLAVDPDVGFVFVHFPTPHMFPIYDRRTKGFEIHPGLDYLDNLALVDRTVGELRNKMEEAGIWDKTTVLITSDHSLRRGLWRGNLGWSREIEQLTAGASSQTVPFVLKVAGDHSPATFESPLYATMTADMALAVLSGEVTTNGEAAAWLERRAKAKTSANTTLAASAGK
jgi:hypothetical protein